MLSLWMTSIFIFLLLTYSQTLWVNKIYTFENDYIRHKYEKKSWFLQRGYPEDLIETEMAKVHLSTRPNENSKKVIGVSFVVIYHPLLKKLNNNIDKIKRFLRQDPWFLSCLKKIQ